MPFNFFLINKKKHFTYSSIRNKKYSFLTISKKTDKCLWIQIVCLSMHTPVLVNNFRMPWYLYISFKSAIACFELKMVYVRQMVRVQGDRKKFRCITMCMRKLFKSPCPRPVPGPAGKWGMIFLTGRAGTRRVIFLMGHARPAHKR